MTATIVRPPLLAMFNVRAPPSRYCKEARLKLICPLPFGPPVATYEGMVPTPVLERVDTDASDGLGVSATNLSHVVLEYGPIKSPPVYPNRQVRAEARASICKST